MSNLSEDGKRIEGTLFPDPDPPNTTFRFSVEHQHIVALQEVRYDDATGEGTTADVAMIVHAGGTIIANDTYDDIAALWAETEALP